MPTLRDLFHTIANYHNKVTLASGYAKDLLETQPLDTLSKEQLKTQNKQLLEILSKCETETINADQKVVEVKAFIYKTLNPDTNI